MKNLAAGRVVPSLLLSAVLAAGCGGPIPQSRFYLIELPAAPAPAARQPAPFTVAVMPLRAPNHLEQDRILYRPTAQEVGFYEYHRWAERPGALLTEALAARLRNQRLFQGVWVFDGRAKADYLLRGRLERLEEVDTPGNVAVRVEIAAEMVEVKTNKTVWTASAAHSGPVTQGDVSAVVAEVNRGVDAALKQLTDSLEKFAAALPVK